jgi:hypothetical protein
MHGWRFARRALGGLLLTVVVTGRLVNASLQLAAEPPTGQFSSDTVFGELLRGGAAGQTFVVERTGLHQVDVLLATFARDNHGPLIFHLKTSPSSPRDLATIRLDAAQVKDNAFFAFRFKPVSAQSGERLYFYLEAPEAEPNNAITIWGTRQDSYPAGEFILNNLPEVNPVSDLAFRLHYYQRPDAPRALGEMLKRFAADKPGLWGRPETYAGLLLMYLGLLFGLGWSLGAVGDRSEPAGLNSGEAAPPTLKSE